MATLLGTTFSTDDQVVAHGDISFMGKTVESHVVEFNQAKYEEFLSSGLKTPRVARQYRRVSSEIHSQFPFGDFSKDGLCQQRHFWLCHARGPRQRCWNFILMIHL